MLKRHLTLATAATCSALTTSALRTHMNSAAAAVDRHAGKDSLLDHLRRGAFVKLAASHISGVGVVAIIDIPAGINPFNAPNPHLLGKEASIQLSANEIRSLPPAVVRWPDSTRQPARTLWVSLPRIQSPQG